LESTPSTGAYLNGLVRQFCLSRNLPTHDPYDVWKTSYGFRIKNFYNSHRLLGLVPAGLFALLDLLNNEKRFFYRPSEYAIVRAYAALCLLNLYRLTSEPGLLEAVRGHLDWLIAHSCQGFSGPCWGLGFPHAVSKALIYDRNTPLSVITPYALESLIEYSRASGDHAVETSIRGIFRFFERDIQVMQENVEWLATSYAPFKDRIVINAVSYSMYARALSLAYSDAVEREQTVTQIRKMYTYIRLQQQDSGSWWYSPRAGSFIDCFHSCIVLKNVYKTNQLLPLEGASRLLEKGYGYLLSAFLDRGLFLFRRFSVANKPGLVRFDLYDSAEALNVALLLGDHTLVNRLLPSIITHFCDGPAVYSQIDIFGKRRSKNTLRWAVMPFLYAVSRFLAASQN